ncbi:MAG: DUF1569 domain-containing protein [Vicinamibacterales bacterium]
MKKMHDPSYRAQLVQRVQALRPDTQRKWGTMSVDQMLWHVSDALALSIGDMTIPVEKPPMPRGLLKFIVLNLPWSKGAPTHPAFVAKRNYDFTAERARCLQLIDTLASRELHAEWPIHPVFGRMTGEQVSRLHAKHLNHHLAQFGV